MTGTDPAVWDVAVVGSGPAGAAAALGALRARPGARVLLLDRNDFPRDKPCGDGIAAQALEVLEGLGVRDAVEGYRPVHRLRLESPGGRTAVRRMSRPAHVVPRAVLDVRLHDAAVAAGAVPLRHRVRSVRRRGDLVVLDGEIPARAVVGADGAESVVRRALQLPSNPSGHVALAVRGYARTGPAGAASEQVLRLTRRGWPAYAWAFPIGDGWSNVGYGELIRSRKPTKAELLDRLHALLPDELDGLRDVRAHRLPLSTRRPQVPDGPVTLAGDALSMINPFTGEGIYYAVLSGALAGKAATAGPGAARAARTAMSSRLGAHLRDTTAVARLTRWPRLVDAGVRVAAGDQAVFDALVELGLGDGRLRPPAVGRIARRIWA